jgi:hypothetical protein
LHYSLSQTKMYSKQYLISYSLFYTEQYKSRFHEYCLGALANVQARDRFFPKYTLRFYVDDRLRDKSPIPYLQKQPGVQIIFKKFISLIQAVQWRYLPVLKHGQWKKIVLIRDCDNVLTDADAKNIRNWSLTASEPPILLYREYQMGFLVCGGGLNVNLRKLREKYGVYTANVLHLSRQLMLEQKLTKPDLMCTDRGEGHEGRGEDELVLHNVFYPFHQAKLCREIKLRMDRLGRYYSYHDDKFETFKLPRPVFESINFACDFYSSKNKLGDLIIEWNDKQGVECFREIINDPQIFEWPIERGLIELHRIYCKQFFKWAR